MKEFLTYFINWLIVIVTMSFLQYINHFDIICFISACSMVCFLFLFSYFRR